MYRNAPHQYKDQRLCNIVDVFAANVATIDSVGISTCTDKNMLDKLNAIIENLKKTLTAVAHPIRSYVNYATIRKSILKHETPPFRHPGTGVFLLLDVVLSGKAP